MWQTPRPVSAPIFRLYSELIEKICGHLTEQEAFRLFLAITSKERRLIQHKIENEVLRKCHPRDYFPKIFDMLSLRKWGLPSAVYYGAVICMIYHPNSTMVKNGYTDYQSFYKFIEPYVAVLIANECHVPLDPDFDF